MLRAVVDPGVLISALISPAGAPAELVRRWLNGEVQLVWSPALVEEFESVCRRSRFRAWFTEDEADAIAALLRDAGEHDADVLTEANPPPDGADAYLVHLAVAAAVDCLVTGDTALREHIHPGLRIVTPRTLLNVLDALDDRT